MQTEVLKWKPRGPVGFAPRVITADLRAGPGAFKFLACVDSLSLENAIEYDEHFSKCASPAALDYRGIKTVSSNLTITFSDFVTEAMAAALFAEQVIADVAPVVVNNEELPVVGDNEGAQLGGPAHAHNITSLVITDSSTGSPVTLVLGTDYTLDAVYGFVTFLDVSTFTQPFIADYSKQNPLTLAGLKAPPINRWLSFQGFNAANANKLVAVDMFNVSFSPASIEFLPDDLGLLTMQASLLIDTTRPTTDPLGQFYSIGLGA